MAWSGLPTDDPVSRRRQVAALRNDRLAPLQTIAARTIRYAWRNADKDIDVRQVGVCAPDPPVRGVLVARGTIRHYVRTVEAWSAWLPDGAVPDEAARLVAAFRALKPYVVVATGRLSYWDALDFLTRVRHEYDELWQVAADGWYAPDAD